MSVYDYTFGLCIPPLMAVIETEVNGDSRVEMKRVLPWSSLNCMGTWALGSYHLHQWGCLIVCQFPFLRLQCRMWMCLVLHFSTASNEDEDMNGVFPSIVCILLPAVWTQDSQCTIWILIGCIPLHRQHCTVDVLWLCCLKV
jgi:hypothetical protein